MPEQHVFEYAVIRVVPRAEREEFLNVGVVLFCPKQKFLQAMILIDPKRLTTFSSQIDLFELEENLCAIERICNGAKEGGSIATLDIASRFRWLTATRSTVVQTSKVHPGLCIDALRTLNKLFNELVLY
jgi:hypothetical protein